MSRPLRLSYPHAWYHVMNRGSGRQKIFKNDHHRKIFLSLLEESYNIFNVTISAYCLMDNHYHLLLSTPDANISRVMRHINGVYTQKYNRSTNTDGPLFRGRFKAKLIEDDYYQLIVSRYIHLNPVEAGMVQNPADYKWSSYSAYLGLINKPSWLSTEIILNNLSTKAPSSIKNYKQYVEETDYDDINIYRSINYTSPVIGSCLFKNKIYSEVAISIPDACKPDLKRIKVVPTILIIMKYVISFYDINKSILINTKPSKLNWPRLVCIYISRKKYGHQLKEISDSLKLLRPEAVGMHVRNCQTRLIKQPLLHAEIDKICSLIEEGLEMGQL